MQLKWVEASLVGHRKNTRNQLSQERNWVHSGGDSSWVGSQKRAKKMLTTNCSCQPDPKEIASWLRRLPVRPSVRQSVRQSVRRGGVSARRSWSVTSMSSSCLFGSLRKYKKFPNFCAISTCPTLCQNFSSPPVFSPRTVRVYSPFRNSLHVNFLLFDFAFAFRLATRGLM